MFSHMDAMNEWLTERERERESVCVCVCEREREREREWEREREKIKFWTLNCTCFLWYTRISNPHSPDKILYRLTMPQFSSLKYAPVTSWDVERSFSVFKNVQFGKFISLNEGNLEKLVVHCLRKNKNVPVT